MRNIPGQIYLWCAVIIFGAANSVTRKLTEIGASNFVNGENPVSLCNVLFVGNICALCVLIMIYGKQFQWRRLRKFPQKQWSYMSITSMMSGAIAPALIFQALAITNVNNVVLIGRLEPPLTLAFSIWLLRERVNFGEILGALVAFIGVFLTISLPNSLEKMMVMQDTFSFGTGEIFTAIASIFLAFSTVISKAKLGDISLGIYSIYRTALGTVIFFFAALYFYGSHHFMEVFSPFLWQWMLIYGPIIVVVGQSCWLAGLRATSISQASLIASFTPVIAVIAAYLILREVPTLAQYIGGAVIFIGIIISQLGIYHKNKISTAITTSNEIKKNQELESEIGFKGI